MNSAFEELLYDILYFSIAQIYRELFLKEQFHSILFELKQFQNSSLNIYPNIWSRSCSAPAQWTKLL